MRTTWPGDPTGRSPAPSPTSGRSNGPGHGHLSKTSWTYGAATARECQRHDLPGDRRISPGWRCASRAVYQDAHGVLEHVFSAATAPVQPRAPTPSRRRLQPDGSDPAAPACISFAPTSQFILDQIVIAERHAAGEDLLALLPNSRVAFGLRTVDGSFNNLVNSGPVRASSARPTTSFRA